MSERHTLNMALPLCLSGEKVGEIVIAFLAAVLEALQGFDAQLNSFSS